jgi:hypothetical protein
MLTKLTTKNQITLPAAIVKQLPGAKYFDATLKHGAVMLKPVEVMTLEELDRIRSRLKRAGISGADIGRAVRWGRRKTQSGLRRSRDD